MSVFIRSAVAISPQNSFQSDAACITPIEYSGNRLACLEPDYRTIIDPKLIRRMGRVIKMGVAAALKCLDDAGITTPDAIITGTAYGCLEDSGTFLSNLVEHDEEPLAPTAFVHSTHNTVAAQIALLTKCHGYNNTFVNGGASFEHALTDAMMLLTEDDQQNILVGGSDELTDISYAILSRFGLYKQQPTSKGNIFNSEKPGTLAGEGAGFFMLSSIPFPGNLARLDAVATLYKPENFEQISEFIQTFLNDNGLNTDTIDLLITGRNGDAISNKLYDEVQSQVLKDRPAINYKQLCGEYPTSAAFALWLAVHIISKKTIPFSTEAYPPASENINNILIYNNYLDIHHSLMLVSSC